MKSSIHLIMYEFFGIVSRFENPTPKTFPNLFRDWSGVQSLGFWFAMVFEDDEDERERERPERVKTLDPLILDQNKRLQSFRFESSLGEAGKRGWENGKVPLHFLFRVFFFFF